MTHGVEVVRGNRAGTHGRTWAAGGGGGQLRARGRERSRAGGGGLPIISAGAGRLAALDAPSLQPALRYAFQGQNLGLVTCALMKIGGVRTA